MSQQDQPTNSEQATSLESLLRAIVADPSIPESKKVEVVIHLTSLTCAIVAVQPIPFADLFVLTPIQVVMVVGLNKILGGPVSSTNPKELLAYLVGVVGWGVLAQQAILGLYKTVLPFVAGVTTIPLVYAATAGLGYAAKALLEAKLRDQTMSKAEIKRIADQARDKAKAEKRDWSVSGIQKEMAEWKSKAESFAIYEAELRKLREEHERLNADHDKLMSENAELQARSTQRQANSETETLKAKLQKVEEKLKGTRDKQSETVTKRFRRFYPSVSLNDRSLKTALKLHPDEFAALEQQIGLLHHSPEKANFRCKIPNTSFEELGFSNGGRFYVQRSGSKITVLAVGNKQTQDKDIKYLKQL